MEQYRKFTKDVLLIGLVSIFISIQQIILIPLLTKTLGVGSYGIWSSIMLTVELISLIASLGLGYAIIRFFAKVNKKEIQSGFSSILLTSSITGFLLSIFLFLISDLIAIYIFKDIASSFFIKLASIMVLVTTLNVIIANFFNALRKTYSYSFLLILQSLGELLLIFYLVIKGFGLGGAILGSLLAKLVVFGVGTLAIRFNIKLKKPNLPLLKKYLYYSLPIAPLALFSWILHSSDIYVIGLFRGTSEIGIYSLVYSLSKVMFLFMGPIGLMLYPAISKAWDHKKFVEAKNYLSYSMKYFLLFAIPTATGLIVLANPLIQIISTKEFLSGYLLFPFIAVGLLLFKAAEVFMYILTSKKQTKLISKIYGFGALMNVILNFVFIPFFGMYGAAFTTFLTYLSILLIMFSKAYTQFKFNLNFKFMIKSVIASMIMGIVVYLFHITSLVMLLSIMLLGAIIYFLAIILMKGITRKELSFFYNFIKR